ncbi:MAG TPA: glycosyltransferase [Bacteroidia bacterium]|nr:glycosyltransferase [Bacteroidia bacterium]
METKDNKRLEYFEKQAATRARIRDRHSYYWNDITYFCNYFAHDEQSVLEIGCGTGELVNHIKGKRKVGIDFSPAMIEVAKSQFPKEEFHCMAAENITLNEKFDLIILSNLISYLDDVQQVLQSLHKLCHSRTKVIVTYHNYIWEPFLKLAESIGLKTKTENLNWLGKNDLNNLLYISGFDVYRSTGRMLLPFNIPLIAPLFNRYIAKLPLFRHFCMNQFSFAKPLQGNERKEYSTSVVIPARNESGNIENAIKRLPKFGNHTEIIFIEGNSTDDTWDTIQKIQQKYAGQYDIKIGQQKGRGKGDAVRVGFDMATCDILMILDADLTVPPEDLVKFYDAMAEGKGDFINGSRLVYPMDKEAMRFLNLLGNKFFSLTFSWLLDRPFKDTLCGTKVIFRDDYDRLKRNRTFFGEFDPFGDYDLLFGAYKLNLKMVEVPIRYKERTYGTTNISRFKHGFLLLRMCAFAARKIKFI